MVRVFIILNLINLLFLFNIYGETINHNNEITSIIEAVLYLRNPYTKLPPSHFGHPGYEKLSFLYDNAVVALILNAAGYIKEAQEILDYFSSRLNIPLEEIEKRMDTNNIYGILKIFSSQNTSKSLKTIVNTIDITSCRRQGKGILEFYTTPGPISFLIFAMLGINPQKYKEDALILGEVLLAMQAEDGGIFDGDRDLQKFHTEPHMDSYSAFLMLYEITQDIKWKQAAEKAFNWFKNKVYQKEEGIIYQGIWWEIPNTIFATDVYSWTLAGPAGDNFSLEELKKLTLNMLNKSLVKISLSLPDERNKTVILCDFSDPYDFRVKEVRGGFHPMGSVEWTGGVILALRKNAVRFFNKGNLKTAKFLKAISEILFSEVMNCFYFLEEIKGKITFYATAQGLEVAPFGAIESKKTAGWKTPFFYVKDLKGEVLVKGGSLVGGWPILVYFGVNPFILKDNYLETYNQIYIGKEDIEEAKEFIEKIVKDREFVEVIPEEIPSQPQILEPAEFNKKMWENLEKGFVCNDEGNNLIAKEYFKKAKEFANKVVENSKWRELAKRDNLLKEKEYGGIIFYPWGNTYPENEHFLHYAILKYPLLNEVATAMWGLVVTTFELEQLEETKYWIKCIIEEVPLHQIADVVKINNEDLIRGYWNALVSWEDNPANTYLDRVIGKFYKEVLREKGLTTAKPKIIHIKPH